MRLERDVADTSGSRFNKNIELFPDWASVTGALDTFPKPVSWRDNDGQLYQKLWIYRGHKKSSYALQPLIERDCPFNGWAEVEHKVLREFQSKARLHMDAAQLPPTSPRYKLSWLAIMQHYGVPTRLLDFTYSPYVALYFALRNRDKDDESGFAEVWAIDALSLRAKAARTGRDADEAVRAHRGEPKPKGGRVSFAVFESSRQTAQREDDHWESLVRKALNPDAVRGTHFGTSGFIGLALPPVQNPRLSSQQGVFLFNGAESLFFEESLERMMRGFDDTWYKRFRVPAVALPEIERQLFQFNVHDLSLFPDTEGLAGFVRQKIRLHW